MSRTGSGYYNKSELKDRDWTEASIKKFLGSPDKTARNSRRRKSPILLYDKNRVHDIEDSPQFKAWLEKSARRRESARRAAAKKRDTTIEFAKSRVGNIHLSPSAVGLSRQELRSRAKESFLALEEAREIRSGGRYQAEGITSRRSEGFFNRIEVNWLRHEATIYDDELTEYFNQVGVGHAVDIVREHVYGLIADAYPHLRDECDRQLEQRRENAAWRYGTDVSKH